MASAPNPVVIQPKTAQATTHPRKADRLEVLNQSSAERAQGDDRALTSHLRSRIPRTLGHGTEGGGIERIGEIFEVYGASARR